MKKILIFLLLSSVIVFANVGKITAVKGSVFVERTTGKETPKSGFILKLNDKIVTEGKSKALVLFNDKTSITVGKDSVLSVNEFVMDEVKPANSKAKFGFGKGVFRTITGKIGKINPKGFKIKTKSASIGIRGTTLDTSVKQLPDGTEKVDVAFLKGSGFIQSDATGQTFNVATNQRASMSAGGEAEVQTGALEESTEMDQDSQELETEAKAQGQETATDEEETTEESTQEESSEEESSEESTEEEQNQEEEQQEEQTNEEENQEEQQNNEEEQQQEENQNEQQNNEEEQQQEENQDAQQDENQNEESTQEGEQQQQEENNEEQNSGDTQQEQQQEEQSTGENQQSEQNQEEQPDGNNQAQEQQEGSANENEQAPEQNAENTAGEDTPQNNEQTPEQEANPQDTNPPGQNTEDSAPSEQVDNTATQPEQDTGTDTLVQNDQEPPSSNEIATNQAGTTGGADDTSIGQGSPQTDSPTNVETQTVGADTPQTNTPDLESGGIPQTDTPQVNTNLPETDTLELDAPEIDTAIPDVDTDIPVITNIPDTGDLLDSVNDATQAADTASDNADDAVSNAPPIVSAGTIVAKEDETSRFSVAAEDSDILTYSIAEQPENGTAEINPQTGEVIYTPHENYNGPESIVINVSDGNNPPVEHTVSFNVAPVNDDAIITLIKDGSEITNTADKLSTSENSELALNFDVSDIEDGEGLIPICSAQSGTCKIEDGEIIYTPPSSHIGDDTLSVSYIDKDGKRVEKTLTITVGDVSIVAISPDGDKLSILTMISKEILCSDNSCDHFSEYMEYGYIKEGEDITGTFVTGSPTPSDVIEDYIKNAQTASYSGGVAAIVNGKTSGGSIDLAMDFAKSEAQRLSGSINVTEGNWQATINSGKVHTHGFDSSDISGTTSAGTITSGSLDGKFYGPNADAVGGSFNLGDSSGSSANGTFGATKK